MRTKPYYSVRTGKNELSGNCTLDIARELFKTIFIKFEDEGYFQEALGYYCVDAGFVSGELGNDLEGALFLELRKSNLAPIRTRINEYQEEDLFDIVEFLYDHCSKPTERHFHSYSSCGWHCTKFNKKLGQEEYRIKVNKVLISYGLGYELSVDGEILVLAAQGFEELFAEKITTENPEKISDRIHAAQTKFRRYNSSADDKRDAIRGLADVLEYLRPKLKTTLSKSDESDLFNIVNNFGIRHHNEKQKTQYDEDVWFNWMFYYYLATIHAVVRLIAKNEESQQ